MRPLVQRSLGPATITNTAKAYGNLLHDLAGAFFQSFGLHLFKANEHGKTIGNAEGRAFGNLPFSVVLADLGHRGDSQEGLANRGVKMLRQIRNATRKGLQLGRRG
jgi:hypothetical protein